MKRDRILTAAGVLLFCLVIVLPPIMHGYVYPNGGDDSAMMHLKVFDGMKEGQPINSPFAVAYAVVGYPIVWISGLLDLSIDVLFLWFYYLALALIGLVIYMVMSRLVSRRAGWLSLALALFCAQGLLFQFHWGQIFNAINIGIVLPLLVYFAVRYLIQGKIYQLALALVLCGLFASFHMSGVYLPFVVGFVTVCYAARCLIKKQRLQARHVLFGIGLTVLPAVVYYAVDSFGVWAIWQQVKGNAWQGIGVSLNSYFLNFVSPTVIVMLVLVAMYFKDIRERLTSEVKVLCVILAGTVAVLAIPAFTGLSLDAFRQGLDMATVLALLVSVLASLMWMGQDKKVVVVLLVVVGFGLFRSLPIWFDYTSAIRPADKEAIAYVNTLDYETYNCSPEVAYWIYDRFTEAQYSEDGSGLVIVRDTPMTPKSDIRNRWYVGHGVEVGGDYVVGKSFDDGKVVVDIYQKEE